MLFLVGTVAHSQCLLEWMQMKRICQAAPSKIKKKKKNYLLSTSCRNSVCSYMYCYSSHHRDLCLWQFIFYFGSCNLSPQCHSFCFGQTGINSLSTPRRSQRIYRQCTGKTPVSCQNIDLYMGTLSKIMPTTAFICAYY